MPLRPTLLAGWQMPPRPEPIKTAPDLPNYSAPDLGRIGGVRTNRANSSLSPTPPNGLAFDYFKVSANQAGATGEVDDVIISDSISGKVLFQTDFESASYTGMKTIFKADDPAGSTNFVFDDRQFSFINRTGPTSNAVMRLNTTGQLGGDGQTGYESTSQVVFLQKLPKNFKISFRMKKLQWGGRVKMMIGPKLLLENDGTRGDPSAFSTHVEGSEIYEAIARGYGDILENPPAYTTGDWLDYIIEVKNKVLTLSINGQLCGTCDFSKPPPAVAPPATPAPVTPPPN